MLDSVRLRARFFQAGLTLAEVVVALAITGVVFAGVFKGYQLASRRAMYASYSQAADALAMQQLEQIITAMWVPSQGITNLFTPSLVATQVNPLGMPTISNNIVYATNYASISMVSQNPPYAMIQVQCVWNFMGMGVFTNTVAVLRGPSVQ
jgi:prepilin-type N-terminal cleavage/methylation domain-containing protein